MRVLIDTNIALDFLLRREPFVQEAKLLFLEISTGRVVGYVTATTLTDIFYISRKSTQSYEKANQAVSDILTTMVICPVDRDVSESALQSEISDFEDALQVACSIQQALDGIITRDAKGFLRSPIPVFTIPELLSAMNSLSSNEAEQ